MHVAVKARQDADHAKTGPCEELKLYLSSPLEQVDDIVSWWVYVLVLCHLSFHEELNFTFSITPCSI
jgi:hypothetical protein